MSHSKVLYEDIHPHHLSCANSCLDWQNKLSIPNQLSFDMTSPSFITASELNCLSGLSGFVSGGGTKQFDFVRLTNRNFDEFAPTLNIQQLSSTFLKRILPQKEERK